MRVSALPLWERIPTRGTLPSAARSPPHLVDFGMGHRDTGCCCSAQPSPKGAEPSCLSQVCPGHPTAAPDSEPMASAMSRLLTHFSA